jgi:hypothetical protein
LIKKKRRREKAVLIFIEELGHSWSCDAFRNTIFSSYKSKLKNSNFILKKYKTFVKWMQQILFFFNLKNSPNSF